MEQREADARPQVALLCGLIALIVLGELVIGPPSAKTWLPLDVFLALASLGAAAMLLNLRAWRAAPAAFAFLGGLVIASVVFPLPNSVWITTHALALVAGVATGALLLRR